MKFTRLDISDVVVLEPVVYSDSRGFFFESFNHQKFESIVVSKINFVQDNHSCSSIGVLRGLHYQLPPKAQDKLVRVVRGSIFDVAVDIRKNSPTFGRWVGEILSAENKQQLWIPAGFAHGFLALTENTEVLYKASEYYAPNMERSIIWNDIDIGIEWPSCNGKISFTVSDKDLMGEPLSEAEVF